MGYTHYWDNDGFTEKQWTLARYRMRRIIAHSDVDVRSEYDDSRAPAITDSDIHFNGVGDDGHETFFVAKEGGSEFCKTARKPYDEIVVAALGMLSNLNPNFRWMSDGDPEDHVDGKLLCDKALGGSQWMDPEPSR